MRYVTMLAMLAAATPAVAELDYVTDRALCGLEYIDRSEQGMTFTGKEFFEIEYYCELDKPFPAVEGDFAHMTLGYCEAPGEVFPTVFVIRSFEFEPGVLYVYETENSDGTAFFNCRP